MEHYTKIVLIVTLLVMWSCSDETLTYTPQQNSLQFNKISYSIANEYCINGVVSRSPEILGSSKNEDMFCSLTGQPRTDNASMSRASFNDIVWTPGYANVGVFMIKHVEDINSITQASQIKIWKDLNVKDDGTQITNTTSDKFLKEVSKYYDTEGFFEYDENNNVTDGIDFFAYYPYAEPVTDLTRLDNISTSLFGVYNTKDPQNILSLPYAMKPTQSDENLWYHDVMVSKRESEQESEFNYYGNIGKKNRTTYKASISAGSEIDTCDNVHLRMVHKFARINICIKTDDRFVGQTLTTLSLSGSKVYSDGRINLLTGTLTPGSPSRVFRLISEEDEVFKAGHDINTIMMAQPTGIINGKEQFVIQLNIEGNKYECDFYDIAPNMEIKEGYDYTLTLSFTDIAKIQIDNYYGGFVTCTENNPVTSPYEYGVKKDFTGGESFSPLDIFQFRYFIVRPQTGWTIKGVYKNGSLIVPMKEGIENGTEFEVYYLDYTSKVNSNYHVVYTPNKWYAAKDHIIQQFDGICNVKFGQTHTDPTTAVWYDISGYGNDAVLKNIDVGSLKDYRNELADQSCSSGDVYTNYVTLQQSGWVNGGIKLDGINDYVAFHAKVPERTDIDPLTGNGSQEFTIDMYLCIEIPQAGKYPRILGEPDVGRTGDGTVTYTTHGYPGILFRNGSSFSSTNVSVGDGTDKRSVHAMGQGSNTSAGEFLLNINGSQMLHVILRYKGGYGDVTNLKTQTYSSSTDNKYNTACLTCESYNEENLSRRLCFYYGDDAQYNAIKAIDSWTVTGVSTNKKKKVISADPEGSDDPNFYLEDIFMPVNRWATIGGRPGDYTRQMNATVFSFIFYDKYLSSDEIIQNFDLHRERFGKKKTDIPAAIL